MENRAIAMKILAAAALVLAVAAPARAGDGAAAKDVELWMYGWANAREVCWSSDPMTSARGCAERDDYLRRLKARGWCVRGLGGSYAWNRCAP